MGSRHVPSSVLNLAELATVGELCALDTDRPSQVITEARTERVKVSKVQPVNPFTAMISLENGAVI